MTDVPAHGGHHKGMPLWQVITTCAIVASAAASASWYVARARIDDELREYERSRTWQLPALVRELGLLSKQLNLQLAERNELQSLRGKVADLKQRNAVANQELEQIRAQREAMKLRLSAFESDTFDLAIGEARQLVPGELAIGLKDATAVTAEAKVQFQEQIVTLAPGQMLRARVRDRDYRVTVVKINDHYGGDTVTFKLNVLQVPPS